MSYTDYSILALVAICYQLCNLVELHHEERLCEIKVCGGRRTSPCPSL